jgi:hypothetical protein
VEDRLLLPDELFLLAHSRSGACWRDLVTVEASLAAGIVAELVLRGRLTADPPATGLVVRSPVDTGEPVLDQALAQIRDSRPVPAYQWLEQLRDGVYDQTSARLVERGLFAPAWCERLAGEDLARHHSVLAKLRTEALAAIRQSDMDSHGGMLARLTWSMELVPRLLGRTALVARYRLHRSASHHWLSRAVRNVIGLHITLPHPIIGSR